MWVKGLFKLHEAWDFFFKHFRFEKEGGTEFVALTNKKIYTIPSVENL